VVVDGNDVLAVHQAAEKAINDARVGLGPTLIECKTYRWLGHHAGDPGLDYRTKEEVDTWKERCPIKSFRKLLVSRGAQENELQIVEADVEAKVRDAMTFALESPFPEQGELLRDVY